MPRNSHSLLPLNSLSAPSYAMNSSLPTSGHLDIEKLCMLLRNSIHQSNMVDNKQYNRNVNYGTDNKRSKLSSNLATRLAHSVEKSQSILDSTLQFE